MPFWEHLDALRVTLYHIIIFLAVAFIGWFIAMPYIFDKFVLGPTSSDFITYKWFALIGKIPFLPDFANTDFTVDIININVASQFMTHMSTSFYFALITSLPFICYEVWKFTKPAFYPNEKKNFKIAFSTSSLLFFAGCFIGYALVFPLTFRFLTEYTIGNEIINQINLHSYIGMFVATISIMGIVFQLPLLSWCLSKLGIINKELLRKGRKYAVVAIMILAAIITPSGDPFTMLTVFLPIYLLYELSIKIIQ